MSVERIVIELLNDVLRCAAADADAMIGRALSRLGQACGFERTYLFVLRPDGRLDNTHEWVAPGIAPMRDRLQGISRDIIAPWLPDFEADRAVFVPSVADLPPDHPARGELDFQGGQSLLLVPLLEGGRFAGFIGYDTVRTLRVPLHEEAFLLRSVANGIAAMMQRHAADAAAGAARLALEDQRNRMRATLSAIPDLILESDTDGRFVAWHTSRPEALATRPEVFMGLTMEQVLPPDVAAVGRQAMADVDRGAPAQGYRYAMTLPDGERWYELSAARRAPTDGRGAHGYVFAVRDITERAEADALLRYRETLLGGLFDLSPIGIMLNDLATGTFLDVNAAFLAAGGHDRDEILGQTYTQLIPPEIRPLVALALEELAATGRYGPMEKEYLRRDGSRYPVVVRGFLVKDPTGRSLIWSFVEDVTQTRHQIATIEAQRQEALDARTHLVTAMDALPDGFVLFDAEDRLVLCNDRYRQIYPRMAGILVPGTTFETILRHGIGQGHYAAAFGREAEFLAETLAVRSQPEWSGLLELADGRLIWVIERSTPSGGRVGLRVDMTARRDNERRLANVIEGAQVGTWEWDLTTDENSVNDRWATMLGYEPADLVPTSIETWHALVHPDDRPVVAATLAQVFSREIEQFEYLLRMRHADGHWVWIQSRGRVLRWGPGGAPLLMAGVHIDVSALKAAEQRVAQIIDGAQVATWTLDAETGVNTIDDRWAAMLGRPRASLEPMTVQTWRRLLHPDDLSVMEATEAANFAAGRDRFEYELRLRHAHGHWVWILSRGSVTARDSAGAPRVLSGVHIDITARKDLEFALQRERDTLARLMETSASGIIAMDAQGRMVFANKEAEAVLGRSQREIEGRPYDDPLWDASDLAGRPLAGRDLPFARAMAERTTLRDLRFSIAWPDGTRRILSVNAAPLSAPGMSASVVCSVTDITDRLAAEATLQAALERAEEGNRAKSEFLATMSHEIRTPLNGVLGMAEVLGHTELAPGQREMLDTIRQSGELLLVIINDILDLAKIEAGRMQIENRPFIPAALAARVESLHAPAARARGIGLVVMSDSGAGLHRRGDANRLLQILHNLVGNAIKFTPSGEVRLLLSARHDGPLVLEISDTGIGMDEAQLGRVFDEFTQADGSITRRFGGTGLGLPIVRRLVRLMGGEITLDSTPGRGTRVRVHLPLPLDDRPGDAAPEAPDAARTDAARTDAARADAVRPAVRPDAVRPDAVRPDAVRSGGEPALAADKRRARGADARPAVPPEAPPAVRAEAPSAVPSDAPPTARAEAPPTAGPEAPPRPDAPRPDIPPVAAMVPKAAPRPLPSVGALPDVSHLRALVAEDNATNRFILKSMLAALGVAHTMVCDGEEAVRAWLPGLFDVLLFDISMPGRDGVSAYADIREKAALAGAGVPPALAVTANAMTQHVAEYHAAGFAACVAKPVRMDDLAHAMAAACAPAPADR
ncbi:PAS domain S-box protein [Paracoccaceae bacterium Fryx2]|nr:PAS domain S-box protein [Paracoccaceae bacterium Fryx2]